ncbi:toxic anion resistance protein [Anaerococcus sp.]|uniref:toxic anion resistance protein n=1 Tax=Anaerococcus sp. TaxID=1872515 RepID=UPI0028FF00C6|nr:toxic anion resistance protein [Anaerococcus sp.]MDU1829272.1 toxic anion resistance protein [Anaerococcus sp.]MDU1864974.1 toxic anion resistance protein [Anaerococcus sp.]
MADYSLDNLMKDSGKVNDISLDKKEIAKLTEKRVEKISPEDRSKIDEIKNQIDLRNSQMSSVYGTNAQKSIAQFSETILSEVRSKDAGEVGELMSDLLVKVNDVDIQTMGEKSLIDRIFGGSKNQIEKYMTRFQNMEVQIDKISAKLETARMEILKDIGVFDKLYEENIDYFKELERYIIAGEESIEEMRNETLPALYKEAEASDEPMAMQVVRDFEENVNRFEKRIFDLKTSKAVALQTAPQIKLIQNNDQLLVDKITDSINNTIPLWKSQVIIALGLNRQQEIVDMQKQVSDTTNELLKRNSENLKNSTAEIQKEAQRSTIDVDTLKEVNQNLIDTIHESMQIQEDATNQRKLAEKELMDIQNNLRDELKNTLTPKTRGE